MLKIKMPKVISRRAVQSLISGFFLVIIINNILFDMNVSTVPPVSIRIICPIGGVATIYDFFVTGFPINIIAIFIVIISLLFGTVYCGWMCPMGTLQDIITNYTKKLHVKKYNLMINSNTDKYLRLIRYLILALLILLLANNNAHYFRIYCINNFLTGTFTGNFAVGGFVILGLIFVACAFLVERPWCKYLCPYGALIGITNKFRFFKVRRIKEQCINCKKCDKNCSMNIKVSDSEAINDTQCISCFECTSGNICPIENTVVLKHVNTKYNIRMELTTFRMTALSSIVFCIVFSYYFSYKDWSYADKNLNDQAKAIITDCCTVEEGNQLKNVYKYKDGIYEGLAVAYRPGMRVLVTIKKDLITEIKIVAHRETRGYYEESFDVIPERIIEKQSTDVDSITGATKTGEGIKKAVENALNKAMQ